MYTKTKIKIIDSTPPEQIDKFYCDLCNFPLISFQDFSMQEEHGVCYECFLTFVEARKKDWKTGWRPCKKEIKEHIYHKRQLNKTYIK